MSNNKNYERRTNNNYKKGNGGYNKKKPQIDPEKAKARKEMMERKEKEFNILEDAVNYLNLRVSEIYSSTDMDRSEYKISAKSIIDALIANGYTSEDTKMISQFTSILSDLARAQTNKNIEAHRKQLRVMYFVDRLHAYFGKTFLSRINDMIENNNWILYVDDLFGIAFIYTGDNIDERPIMRLCEDVEEEKHE